MQKINALLNNTTAAADGQLNQLLAQANSHLDLQQFWQAIAPKIISQSSFVSSLHQGVLTIYAHNGIVASKVKLTSASLLKQLQNLQKEDPLYKHCKVTRIKVKVQVKSQEKHVFHQPRKLSNHAATTLRRLANDLGDSTLADKLNQLADNA